MTLAFVGAALAGYYGREWQDVIDHNVANPIGPYEVRYASDGFIKTHPRTGRIWIASAGKVFQWVELPSAVSQPAAGKF
jgi:hypothetical protein